MRRRHFFGRSARVGAHAEGEMTVARCPKCMNPIERGIECAHCKAAESTTAHCCFGKRSVSPCGKPAVWASTFDGRETGLVWCHAHKPEIEILSGPHGFKPL